MNNLCLISKHWCVILVYNCMELADVCPFDSLFIFCLSFPFLGGLGGGGAWFDNQNQMAEI